MELIERAIAKAKAEAVSGSHALRKDWARPEQARGNGLFSAPGEPFVASPPLLEENRVVSWNKWHPATPAFDLLRTKVLRMLKGEGWNTVGVVSPTEDCGKTTVALNLAFSVAHQMPAEVVIVDFDLRQPQVAGYLGIEPKGDLTSFLEGRGPLVSHMVTAGEATVRVVPSLPAPHNATELLCKSEVDLLLREMFADREGRIAIFDLPPLLITDDALAVLPRLDCALLVVGERQSTKAEVSEALSLLGGINLLGVVLNASRTKVKGY